MYILGRHIEFNSLDLSNKNCSKVVCKKQNKMSDAKEYISKKQIPQLFECLMTSLMYHRPSDHIAYLQQCLEKIKTQGVSGVRWDLFLEAKRTKTPLPPVTPPRSGKHSSRASSVSELSEKKPVLPPIGAPTDVVKKSSPAPIAKLRAPLTCPVVLVMGGPGSGKRLLCSHLAQRYGFAGLCAGDLVRARIRDSRDSRQLWSVAAAAFERGDAVPEELLLPVLIDAVNESTASGRCAGLIIEGYPRTVDQSSVFAERIKRPDRALLLDFEEDLLQERLLRRYHRLGAIEDQPGNIGRRIGHFKSNSLPACRLYDEERKLVIVQIDEDLDDAALFAEAARALDPFYKVVDAAAGPKKDDAAASSTKQRPGSAEESSQPLTHIAELSNLPAPVKRPSDLPQCPLVLVMGGPGSGRSSQIKRLAERYQGFVHVNASEEARKRSLESGADAAWSALLDIAVQGDLDEEVGVAELRRLLAEKGRGANCILLEGYPINENQLREMFKVVGEPDLIVLLDCEEVYMVRRLLSRGKVQGGLGDNLGAVSKRMAYFKEHTLPVVRYFDLAGKLCIILGDRDDSEVFYDLASLFDYVFFNQKPQHVQQEEQRAANTIQAAFEGFLTRQEFAARVGGGEDSRQMDEDTAAETIQAGFEGLATREEFAARAAGEKPAMNEDAAAETIQAAFEGFKTREEFAANQQPAAGDQNEEDEQNAAATKIQANFRGYQTRKSMAAQRD